jgi:hypothetical protein
MTTQPLAAGNVGWRLQFFKKSLVGGCYWFRVPELWTHTCLSVCWSNKLTLDKFTRLSCD